MKPDWDKLAKEYADTSGILIADVDCTAAGESLCKKHDVSGYPTLKMWRSGEMEDYGGGRSLDDLRAAASSLGPSWAMQNKPIKKQKRVL